MAGTVESNKSFTTLRIHNADAFGLTGPVTSGGINIVSVDIDWRHGFTFHDPDHIAELIEVFRKAESDLRAANVAAAISEVA
jgi:hypothetical protein